ncbi:hypothetical protein FXO38_23203, partial [Capsicum annuum]
MANNHQQSHYTLALFLFSIFLPHLTTPVGDTPTISVAPFSYLLLPTTGFHRWTADKCHLPFFFSNTATDGEIKPSLSAPPLFLLPTKKWAKSGQKIPTLPPLFSLILFVNLPSNMAEKHVSPMLYCC